MEQGWIVLHIPREQLGFIFQFVGKDAGDLHIRESLCLKSGSPDSNLAGD